MKILGLVFFTLATTTASMGLAQAIPTTIDCDDPANAEEEVCLAAVGAAGVTNFAPLIAGGAGLLAVGALAGGGSTTSTTSTTSTN